MTEAADLPTRSDGLSHAISAFSGPPPLIAGESAADYDGLLARVCETLRPSDVLEQIWTRDIVDLVWEVLRLRRLKAGLMSAAAYEGMEQVLEPLCEHPVAVARAWAARREDVVEVVENTLAAAGIGMDAVTARTFAVRIGDFERIDRMMMAAEARRSAALRELDLHRASFALRLRRTVQDIEQDIEQAVEQAELVATPAGEQAA